MVNDRVNRMVNDMERTKGTKKKPSRLAYEESHPTVSFRLDREIYDRLKRHLNTTGCSFADFVKDALGREESMIEKRVTEIVSKELEEKLAPPLDLELYDIVLDLARWNMVLWMNLPQPLQIHCPDCLFPPAISHKERKIVSMEMVEKGDFKCPECGLTIKNPPQLAWVLLVDKVAEEYRREKFAMSQQPETSEGKATDDDAA